jgi:hypothetical protein
VIGIALQLRRHRPVLANQPEFLALILDELDRIGKIAVTRQQDDPVVMSRQLENHGGDPDIDPALDQPPELLAAMRAFAVHVLQAVDLDPHLRPMRFRLLQPIVKGVQIGIGNIGNRCQIIGLADSLARQIAEFLLEFDVVEIAAGAPLQRVRIASIDDPGGSHDGSPSGRLLGCRFLSITVDKLGFCISFKPSA